MKKLLFVMMHLHMGGAERSLVNLLSEIDYSQYEVDLLLIKKEGETLCFTFFFLVFQVIPLQGGILL